MPAPPSSPPVALSTRTVRGLAAVSALGPQWDALSLRAGGSTAFVSRAWMEPWMNARRTPGETVAATAWAGDRLVGLFVLAVRSRFGARIATPATTGAQGCLGVLVDRDHPEAAARMAELCVSENLFHAFGMD